jgi:hypothetical protein
MLSAKHCPKKFQATLLCVTCILFSASLQAIDQASQPSPLKVGEARLSKLLWDIYDSRLYTPNGVYNGIEPGLVLEIAYLRKIPSKQLLDATRKEWRAMSLYDKAASEAWLQQLRNIWPDVIKGDVIRLEVGPQLGSHFLYNGRPIGSLREAEFTHRFLAIWLSPQSRYSELQQQLTGAQKNL